MMTKKSVLITIVILLASIHVKSDDNQIVKLSDIYSGMKCHGYTSFSGHELEKLDIEIIGVVEGMTPDDGIILAYVDSPTVRRGGIMSGMSGSPVYYGDRLIGAMSLAYPFAKEAVCGITPIEAIHKLEDLAAAPNRGAQYRPRRDLVSQSISTSGFELIPIGLSVQTSGISPLTDTPVFDTGSFRMTRSPGMVMPSHHAPQTMHDIQPGSPIGVALVSGDVSIVAHGTVTDVRDRTLFAFGHRMFGLGECLLPIHASEVVSIIPSLYISFKLSNTGPPIGAMTFDSEAGITGELGRLPPVVPVDIVIDGFTPEPAAYRIDVAENENLTTGLILQSVYGIIQQKGGIEGDLSMEIDVNIELSNGLSIHRNDFFGSVNHAIRALHSSLTIVENIHKNPLKPVAFENISIQCKLAEKTRVATLDSVSVLERTYKPGELIHVNLRFHGDRIESFTRSVRLPIPDTLPPGQYVLKVLDSATYQRDVSVNQLPAHHYNSFEDWFETLGDRLSGNQMFIALAAPGSDIHSHGSILPSVPAVMQGLMTMPGIQHGSVRSSRLISFERIHLEVEVIGAKSIPVYVNRRPERQK
jgi:hypothetical protein